MMDKIQYDKNLSEAPPIVDNSEKKIQKSTRPYKKRKQSMMHHYKCRNQPVNYKKMTKKIKNHRK